MRSMQSVVLVHRVHTGILLSRDQRLRRVQRKVLQTKFFEGYEAGEFFLFEDSCVFWTRFKNKDAPVSVCGVIYGDIVVS